MTRILIAADGSPASLRALEFGASLAAKLGERLLLVHVLPQVVLPLAGVPGTLTELQESIHEEGTRLLDALADKARAHGVAVERELALGDPATVIAERAGEPSIHMVVMGSRGQGTVARLLLGSVASKVVHLCTRPVVVVR